MLFLGYKNMDLLLFTLLLPAKYPDIKFVICFNELMNIAGRFGERIKHL